MIVIADGGSTKCDWILFDANGSTRFKVRTKGLNPSMLKRKEIEERLYESQDLADFRRMVTGVYFYGAGCGTPKYAALLEKGLAAFFENAMPVRVREDLAGAVYSCTAEPAVVAILGTGSNCCYFNGTDIEVRMPSLGYTLMDDASGNHLGKLLLRAFYFKQMPADLEGLFRAEFKLKPAKVKKHLYKKTYPNAYLASFAPFALGHQEHPFMQGLLRSAFTSFIETHLGFYTEECREVPVHFVGSVAYHARKLISAMLEEKGMIPGKFIRRPIDGLLEYHRDHHEPFSGDSPLK
ncbi:N-acetylglucosamine kinase [Robertkochia marina]|uniref:N-acetylglucosamine kinase n=1 Tax=Robertkochia marina TaxID=1227945 RepID=A0A4S3M2Q3_9FLAO|nr:N-acetylglucosamine kinase [Robertkochia marina]THD68965.1 N-acetylglucosamine kinase [Robertkochia marina]TRZ44784.1 N-acetylglucosamine kinase [Robertkochia marina]